MIRDQVYALIDTERAHQHAEWWRDHQWGFGDCSHPDLDPLVKHLVLTEELGEIARAIHDQEGTHRLQAELTQLAASAVAWLESL